MRATSTSRTGRGTKAHKTFAKLTKFTAQPMGEANEHYELGDVNEDWQLEDVFGELPDVAFVHEGNVTFDGKLSIRVSGEYAGVYIIEGDLVVKGALELVQTDGGSILYVTGNVRAKSVSLADQAQLWIGKDLIVDGPITTELEDAGCLLVRGKQKSKTPKTKANAKKGTATSKRPLAAFAKLAKFEAITVADAGKRFRIAELRGEADWKGYIGFAQKPPPAYVHEGSVRVSGNVTVRADDAFAALYVIDGDLEISRMLELESRIHSDWGALVVTGSVHAKNLAVIDYSKLWIGKNLTVDEYVFWGSDELFVRGATTAKAILARTAFLRFQHVPKAKVLAREEITDAFTSLADKLDQGSLNDVLRPEVATLTMDELVRVYASGKPIMR